MSACTVPTRTMPGFRPKSLIQSKLRVIITRPAGTEKCKDTRFRTVIPELDFQIDLGRLTFYAVSFSLRPKIRALLLSFPVRENNKIAVTDPRK